MEKGKEPAPRMAPLTSVPASEFLLDQVRLVEETGERSSVNIAQNGDFESWSDGVPTVWSVAGSPQVTQSDDAKSEKLSIKIQTDATGDQGIYQGQIEVSPGTEYTLFFYYKVNSGQFLIRIDDNASNLLQGRLRATEWSQYKKTVRDQRERSGDDHLYAIGPLIETGNMILFLLLILLLPVSGGGALIFIGIRHPRTFKC